MSQDHPTISDGRIFRPDSTGFHTRVSNIYVEYPNCRQPSPQPLRVPDPLRVPAHNRNSTGINYSCSCGGGGVQRLPHCSLDCQINSTLLTPPIGTQPLSVYRLKDNRTTAKMTSGEMTTSGMTQQQHFHHHTHLHPQQQLLVQHQPYQQGLLQQQQQQQQLENRPETSVCRRTIICERCGQCRCESCTVLRELPRAWCGQCECSVQHAVDVVSCLCCVQAAFYHCSCVDETEEEDESRNCSDDPCACCERPQCCQRWSCMLLSAASCLPCLLVYWPLRVMLSICTGCYNVYAGRNGCRCKAASSTSGCRGGGSGGGSSSGGGNSLLLESESSAA